MSPWAFEPRVFVVPAFPGWKNGGGICGGFVEAVRLTNEDGSAVAAGMRDSRQYPAGWSMEQSHITSPCAEPSGGPAGGSGNENTKKDMS